ncbi:MAG: radical SAM family heme chaperone HemW [Flavihumibacter sp.]|nr:radical SAM family heme chaperone HemW [Flavihumibacter sp.]
MAGIYLHIPFCKKACHYCNFHFSTSLGLKNDLIAALLKEIALQKEYLQGQPVNTIYFGGGTPSILEASELEALFNELNKHYNINSWAEITLEANPDDITATKLHNWKTLGINRLSIGIQSFFEEDLLWMNRAHNAAEARQCLATATRYFQNITIDLIYGSPLLTNEQWLQNLSIANSYNIPHLSCYALTVEPDTALQKMIALQKKEAVDSDKQAQQFLQLMDWASQHQYEHYEISNFAKTGYHSKHNSAYWQGVHYLGLGPSAHSYNGNSRQWNRAHTPQYINALQQNNLLTETEQLSTAQQLNETIMIGLRTKEGINLLHIAARFGPQAAQQIQTAAAKHLQLLHLQQNNHQLQLTQHGKLFADAIAADLFV